MKNTDYNLKQLESAISAEGGMDELMALMNDLDLQVVGVTRS